MDIKMQDMKMYWHILHRHDKHEKQTFLLYLSNYSDNFRTEFAVVVRKL